MLKEELEKKLTEEGKKFTPNVIDKVYASLGIQFVSAKQVEENLSKEGDEFVPDVKPQVMKEVNTKKVNPFLSFLSRPVTIGALSAGLITAIAVGVLVPSLANKTIQTGDTPVGEVDGGGNNNQTATLNALSSVSMSVKSASETYNPSVIYTIGTDGLIQKDDVVSLNDDGSLVVANLETEFNRSTVTYGLQSFTSKFLFASLNLGYLERQDASKPNKITIEINYDSQDDSYFQKEVTALNEEISSFVYENRIIATFECNENQDEIEDVDSEKIALIRVAYELATKLFVTSDGKTTKLFCFSTNFDDWIEKYKDTSLEELQDYIQFLKDIEDLISDDSMKELFMEDIVECSKYQEAMDEIIVSYEQYRSLYREILDYFNSTETGSEPRPDFTEDLEGDMFDWWHDFGHDHHHPPHDHEFRYGHHGYGRYFYEDLLEYERFKDDIDRLDFSDYKEMGGYEMSMLLRQIEDILDDMKEFYHSFNHCVSMAFESLIRRLEDGEFFDENRPPHGGNYIPEPEGWEDEFEEWWSHHHF